ncbi:MAG: hypothetical protein JSV65_05135 [Armatimonadota bacterium]|nr:MAG: hypothetical protein JSV65_05135 [Armatimonadota bacterium]
MLRTAILYLVSACLVICGCHARAAEVDPSSPDLPAGVGYALQQLREVADARVVAEVGGANLPEGLAQRGDEAYAIAPDGDGFRVAANANAGLMHGLLELRDAIQAGAPPTKPSISSPALKLRGDSLDFPFHLGNDLYDGRWRHHANIEHSADSWWLDRGHWEWRLKRCADLRMNALLLCHPHPFPALIDLPEHPEAAYFEPAHLERLQRHFRWILDEAEQYGVRIYLLTWNIWTSPGFAEAHDIAQEGTDSPLVRAYTRACYRRLFETYPKLAGVMTMAGEAPPGCVAFVRDAIVGGLNELAAPPELLYWIWCSYPEDAQVIFDEYKGPASLVHYLQYEQLFRPQADPRIRRASEALGGVPVITLGGLGTATGWLYWSDPYYIREIMADLPRQNGAGCFFQGLDSFGWVAEKWLGWEALGRYWWNPSRPREDDFWRMRIAKRYGVTDVADDFLAASIEASSIPTRLLALLHRQTDHFMPQFGLPLVAYLGLPTLSTYVFENHEGIDEKGRLVPRLGLTWPNPDWGERVVGVRDFVAGKTDGTTPVQIADELERSAKDVLDRVRRMRGSADAVTCGAEKWSRMLDQMEMNGHLGVHTAAKIRAAVAWARWRKGSADADDVLVPLRESVGAMEKMADAAARIYPGIEISTWRPGISRPPPWTNLQIWQTDRYRKHDFSDSAAMFRRELEWIEGELSAGYPQPLLPFEDDLAPKPPDARLVLRWDCGAEPPQGLRMNSFPPDAVARIAAGDAPAPLARKRLVAEHRKDDFWFPLTTDPQTLPLRIGKSYWVSMDYWIISDAEELGEWLSAGARTTEGGWRNDIGARYMGGPAGTRGKITLTFAPETWDDFYVYVSIHGAARVELDNVEIWEGSSD